MIADSPPYRTRDLRTVHSQQKTSYVEMSKGLADSRIEKMDDGHHCPDGDVLRQSGNQLFLEKIS